jgi:hypothetical protein
MADTMGVAPASVRSHVRDVLAALGVHSRLGAASFVLCHGTVGLRYRLQYVGARLTRGQRRLWLRVQRSCLGPMISRPPSSGYAPLPGPAG